LCFGEERKQLTGEGLFGAGVLPSRVHRAVSFTNITALFLKLVTADLPVTFADFLEVISGIGAALLAQARDAYRFGLANSIIRQNGHKKFS
jgi:hypothetical protein